MGVYATENDRLAPYITRAQYELDCLEGTKNLVIKVGNQLFKNAEKISSEQLCLPLYPGLKKNEIDYVAQSFKKTLSEFI